MSSSNVENISDCQNPARPVTKVRKDGNKSAARLGTHESTPETLEARCRSVIVANLERYPPKAFGILPEDAWESIVRVRHETTMPSTGTGGIDGTGRLLPAITDRFLSEVEQANPHFADSDVVDRLAWKDCVEYKYRAGGLTRPPTLLYPWPVLVERLQRSGDGLIQLLQVEDPSEREQQLLEYHVQLLSDSPMSVSLLQACGAGKSVKKFVKACRKEHECSLNVHTERPIQGSHPARTKTVVSPLAQLEETLQRWKNIAANSGVQINTSDGQSNEADEDLDHQEDMRLVESCQSWRDLFSVLQRREEKRRASQGARMRKIRKDLATGRPKIIKVRPTSSRHDNILDQSQQKKAASGSSSSVVSCNSKMKALKKESAAATLLQKSSARAPVKKLSSFGSAVAVATTGKSNPSMRKVGQTVSLAGGKQLKLPSKGAKRSSSLFTKHKKPGQSRR